MTHANRCALSGFVLFLLLGSVNAWADDMVFADDFEMTSTSIGEALAAPDGPASIAVSGAIVTHLKPQVETELPGFFIQGRHAGPALYVEVDPATTIPAAKPGDRVAFTITHMATVGSMRRADGIADFSRQAEGVSLAGLVQDVSSATDLVTNLDNYDSELVALSGTITSAPVAAGSGFLKARFDTVGIQGQLSFLRAPQGIFSALGLTTGCNFTAGPVPMWRFDTQAQPTVFETGEFLALGCPAPTVMGAIALSPTSVLVTFDRPLDPGSVSGDGSQFTFDQGLVASAATPSSNTVTVTTTSQSGNLAYTVAVAGSVKDVLGTGLGQPDSAMFPGYVMRAKVLINEINPNLSSSRDLIELLVTQSGSTAGLTLHQLGSVDEVLATLPDIQVAAGDLIVIHQNPDTTNGPASETMSKTQYPKATFAANYDGAWDVLGTTVGLTFSNRVIEVRDAADAIVDAVPFVQSTSPTPPAAFPARVQELQASGWWLPADCGGMPCSYTSIPTVVDVAVDYFGVGTTAAGNSVQRNSGGVNQHSKFDWNAASAQSFGLPNP